MSRLVFCEPYLLSGLLLVAGLFPLFVSSLWTVEYINSRTHLGSLMLAKITYLPKQNNVYEQKSSPMRGAERGNTVFVCLTKTLLFRGARQRKTHGRLSLITADHLHIVACDWLPMSRNMWTLQHMLSQSGKRMWPVDHISTVAYTDFYLQEEITKRRQQQQRWKWCKRRLFHRASVAAALSVGEPCFACSEK